MKGMMPGKRKSTPPNQDVEILAVWLHGAACLGDADSRDKLRRLVAKAAQGAKEMYESPEDHNSDGEPPEDGYNVRSILSRFAAELDELERQYQEDNK